MYKATIIENSLSNKGILKKLDITKTWKSGDWILRNVLLNNEQIEELSQFIEEGPWYIHAWEEGKDDVKVIFRDKLFDIKYSDKSTWADAIEYGLSLGIPKEQLDFRID